MQNALKVSFGVTKRAFTIAVVVATLAWSVAATFAVAPRVASAATSGDLVKGSMSAVYYIGSDNKRYVFTNDKAYKTWYADFSTVKTISDTELAAITIGGNVTYKPGVKMIKIQSDPKVYAVAKGGVLRWVSTEAAAVALYGSNWNTKIDDISDAFFTNYTVGAQISSASDFVIANEQSNAATINADKGLAGGGALNITLASDNPASATVTRNAQGINLLKVNIAGAGTVTGLTFTRKGAGVSSDWSNVYLYDGDSRLTTGRSVSSTTNQVVFSNLNVVVSGSKVLTLIGDLLSAGSTIGNAHYFSLDAATNVVASATVGGSFPVSGNTFSIAGSLGGSITASVGSTPSNPKLGQTGVEIANFKLAASGTEDVSVRRLVITNSGAGSLSNVANMAITTGGTTVAQNPIVSGSTATFVFAVPYVLAKGVTRSFSVIGDMSSGIRAGVDTFKLYVDQSYDIYATGNTYGAGVSVTDSFDSSVATTLSVQGGQITFAFNGPTTGDVSVGANDAVIQKFAITAVNHVEVRDLRMQLATSADISGISGAVAAITDCKVKNTDTGSTVTNSYDLASWTIATATTYTKTFTDRFEISAGQTVNLALTCDISSTAPAGLAAKSLTGSILARVAGDIRNLDSNLDVALTDIVPSSTLAGNPQTIRVSGLTVGIATSPSSSTVTKGSTTNVLGVNFTAGSASDVKVTQMKFRGMIDMDNNNTYGVSEASTGTDTSTHYVADVIQSATIWDGSTQIGVAMSPDSTGDMNFSNLSWTVPAGTTKTVTVKVILSNNLPYGSSVNHVLVDMIGTGTDNTSANITAQDKDSNAVNATSSGWAASDYHLQAGSAVTVATTMTSTTGIIVTPVASGSLTIQVDGDTPVSSIVTANTTDNSVTRVKFSSVNEAFNVTRLTVQNMAGTSSRSITSVRLFDKNGTLFCSGALDSSNRLRCANDAGLFTVDGNNVVTVKMNIDQEGSGTTGANSGDKPKLALVVSKATDAGDVYADDIKVVGVSSGTALVDTNVGGGSLTVTDNALSTSITVATAGLSVTPFVVGEVVSQAVTTATGRIVSMTAVATNTVFTVVDTTGTFTATANALTGASSGATTAASVSAVATGVVVGIEGNTQTIRKTQPTVATVATSTTLVNGQNTIYKFSVTAASNADVSLRQVSLLSSFSGAFDQADTLQVYENGSLLDTTLYDVTNTAGGTLKTTTDIGTGADFGVVLKFTTERVVSAGTTKTYEVKATVAGATAGESISTSMVADVAATGADIATGTVAQIIANSVTATHNFIWSDNSADVHDANATPASTSSDWANGYLVKSLPTTMQTLSL